MNMSILLMIKLAKINNQDHLITSLMDYRDKHELLSLAWFIHFCQVTSFLFS